MTVKYYARLVLNTCAESRKFCELVLFFFVSFLLMKGKDINTTKRGTGGPMMGSGPILLRKPIAL